MTELLPILISFSLVIFLVVLNGFFVAAEFSIIRAQTIKLRGPEYRGKYGVKSALSLIESIDSSLSSTQLGITIASLVLGWWGELTLASYLSVLFDFIGEPYSFILSHGFATASALVLIIFLHVVLGELVAKSIAIRYPETTLRFVAGPMQLFSWFFHPFLRVLSASANLVLRIFGVYSISDGERVLSGAEIAMLASRSRAGGMLDKDEERMIHGVFSFSNTVAREVMTPRTDLVAIPIESNFDQVLKIISDSGFSRFPVIEGRIDSTIGLLLSKDVMDFVARLGDLEIARQEFSLSDLMREPYFIPNTKPLDDLLNEFKKRKHHMAVVLDEHGGVDGVVTMEDLLEEIVGDIFDESDIPENQIIFEKNGDIILDGGLLVDDLNSSFSVAIPEGDYDTVAGFILSVLGVFPEPGAKVFVGTNGSWSEQELEELKKEKWEQEHPIENEAEEPTKEQQNLNGALSEQENEAYLDDEHLSTFVVEEVLDHRIERVRLLVSSGCAKPNESLNESNPSEPSSYKGKEKRIA